MRLQRASSGSDSLVELMAAVVIVFAAACPVHAQVNYTSTTGAPYIQTFDTLLQTGRTAFQQSSPSTTVDTTNQLVGWYAYRSGSSTQITANDGSMTTGGLYSYGSTGSSDRALGSIGATSTAIGDFVWAVRIRNNTGLDITGFTIKYTGEQWRYSAATQQTVQFSYGIFASGNAPSQSTLLNTAAAGFTAADGMRFSNPVTSGSFGALDGNMDANRTILTQPVHATIPVGQDLWVRWNDINHAGNDHGFATDDISFTATSFQPVPAPPAAISLGIGGFIGLLGARVPRLRFCNRK